MASCCPVCGLDEKLRYIAEDPYYDAVKEYNRKLKSGEIFVCSKSRNAWIVFIYIFNYLNLRRLSN